MKKKLIKLSSARQAQLVGVMIWSAHYHGGQGSREYRIGCRARMLLKRSNEIGSFLASRWFDTIEPYITGEKEIPRVYKMEFSQEAKRKYLQLENFSLGGTNKKTK